jgi:DNA-directed RNA polymerase subunit RPC12/RpoP
VGSIIAAQCLCGFSTKMALGGGIRSHEYLCVFPALCSGCGAFWPVNLLDRGARCPTCSRNASDSMIPYDDPSLAGTPGQETVFSWSLGKELGRTPKLTDGTYVCPHCRKPTLAFSESGFWD